MKKLAIAFLLAPLCGAFLLGPAQAQKTKAQLNIEVGTTFPDNASGQITPSGVRLFQNDVINSIMPTAPVGDGNFACYNGTTGLLKDCGSSPSAAFVGTSNIQNSAVTNPKIAPGAANTMKGSLDGSATSDIALVSCSLAYRFTQWVSGSGWQCGISPVVPTRATAAALDLSAHSAIRTLGYATAGDGGGATFQKVGSNPLLDSFVTAVTLTGNGTSGCTNNTYRAVKPTGGTGSGLVLTVTVSGNVVTAATITGTGGNAYTVGDVLSTTITGCSTTVTVTVSTVSTPTGSFTDSAGNHWQIVEDGSPLNIRQFGAKQDWTGTDGTATNDFTAIQNALSFAGRVSGPTPDAGGITGATIWVPRGASLICGGSTSLLVPGSVRFVGSGANNSVLKLCDSGQTSGTHVITLCDPNTQASCFGAMIADMTMYANGTPPASANIAFIYSNNVQQLKAIQRVAIYSGLRSGIRLETGYGGAAYIGMSDVFITPWATGTAPGIIINYGTTLIDIHNVIVETGGSGMTANGIQIAGGFVTIDNFHTEQISTGVFVNIPTSNANGIVTIRNASGGSNCTNLVTRQSGSAASSVIVSSLTANGCTNTVNNAGVGTGSVIIAGQTVY